MVDRHDMIRHIKETYGIESEHLWMQYPNIEVFRHENHKKWFGIIMSVTKDKVGLEGEGNIDGLNVKCDPERVMFLSHQSGFAPAYHMNKKYWISILMDGAAPDALIYELVDISYNLTK